MVRPPTRTMSVNFVGLTKSDICSCTHFGALHKTLYLYSSTHVFCHQGNIILMLRVTYIVNFTAIFHTIKLFFTIPAYFHHVSGMLLLNTTKLEVHVYVHRM